MATTVRLSRRRFLHQGAAAGLALTAPLILPGHVFGRGAPAPSERIVLGVIGYGGRCGAILPHFLAFDDVRCVAVADCRAERLALAKRVVDTHHGTQDCAAHADFRELLGRRDVDAVLIATGDRWHTPLSILAAKAGKDIYCEKPVSMTIAEGRALADTMARYGIVHQTGHQRRSVGSYAFQVEVARSGMIGKVHTVLCQVWEGPTVARDTPQPVPAGFDYDMWLGPVPWRPYSPAFVNGWNYFWDTGAGPVIGMGCHYTDIAQWGLLRDDTGPVTYAGTATWKPDAYSDTPVTADCCGTYADGVKIVLRSSGAFQDRYIRFVGTEGWIQVDDETDRVTAEPASILTLQQGGGTSWANASAHIRDFLDGIRTRRPTQCNPEVAHRAMTICQAWSISLRLGQKLGWDPATERFNLETANQMLWREPRAPWRL